MPTGIIKEEMYLDIDVFVNLDCLAEDEDVLHEIRELPHVSNLIEQARSLRWRGRLHLCPTTLAGHHDDEAPGAETRRRRACGKLPDCFVYFGRT